MILDPGTGALHLVLRTLNDHKVLSHRSRDVVEDIGRLGEHSFRVYLIRWDQ